MEPSDVNMLVRAPSRKKPRAGDHFVLEVRSAGIFPGRVVSTTAVAGFGPPQSMLIYIYRETLTEVSLSAVRPLTPASLLIPPVMTNRQPWLRGYFETLSHSPLEHADTMAVHAFWSSVRQAYFDESGRSIEGDFRNVGPYALQSYRTIDDLISDALGLPRAG